MDLDTPDGGTIRFNNVFNATQRSFIDYYRNYPTEGSEMFYGARDREQNIYTFTSALRGEQYLKGWQLNWGASYARSQSHDPFDFDISFTEPSATDPQGNPIAGMGRIPPEELKGPPESIISHALNNFERAYFYTAFYREEENREGETTLYLDLARDYALGGGVAGQFKLGGKFRSKTRFRERSELLAPYYNEAFPRYVRTADGQVVPKDFTGTPFEQLQMVGDRLLVTNFLGANPEDRDLFDRFRLYPMIDRDLLRTWWDLNRDGFSDQAGTNPEFERNLEADAYFYDLTERVSAAYVMNTLHFGPRVSLIAGVRVERENNDYLTRYTPDDLSGFPVPKGAYRDTSSTFSETIWLPNVHLTLRPTDFLTVRLAAYKALARPNYNQRLPSFVARKAGTFYPGNSLFVGNPDLKAAQAWNYEVNVALYDGRFGLFSVSAFYKDIKNMYHQINGAFFDAASADSLFDRLGINVTSPFQNEGFALTYPYNSSKPTRVWGVEIEHQANFLFLPGVLRNLVLTYNLSFIRSETYIPGTQTEEYCEEILPGICVPKLRYHFVERKHKLERQPDFLSNVAIGYDYRGFSARLPCSIRANSTRAFRPMAATTGWSRASHAGPGASPADSSQPVRPAQCEQPDERRGGHHCAEPGAGLAAAQRSGNLRNHRGLRPAAGALKRNQSLQPTGGSHEDRYECMDRAACPVIVRRGEQQGAGTDRRALQRVGAVSERGDCRRHDGHRGAERPQPGVRAAAQRRLPGQRRHHRSWI